MKMYAATSQSPPWSSYESTQKSRTYDAVKASGEDGISREDICKNTNLPKQRVWFYLSELRRAGLIRRLGEAVDVTTLSPTDAKLHALVALENAFAIGTTAHFKSCSSCRGARSNDQLCKHSLEMTRALLRYNKIKALALGAKTQGEEAVAMRMALIDLVKMIF